MIRVQVRQEDIRYAPQAHVNLPEPLADATTGVKKEALPASFDERSGPESIDRRLRRTGPQQGYLKLLRL
jgi:hypothetical protein